MTEHEFQWLIWRLASLHFYFIAILMLEKGWRPKYTEKIKIPNTFENAVREWYKLPTVFHSITVLHSDNWRGILAIAQTPMHEQLFIYHGIHCNSFLWCAKNLDESANHISAIYAFHALAIRDVLKYYSLHFIGFTGFTSWNIY